MYRRSNPWYAAKKRVSEAFLAQRDEGFDDAGNQNKSFSIILDMVVDSGAEDHMVNQNVPFEKFESKPVELRGANAS